MPRKSVLTDDQIDEICRLREEDPRLGWKRIGCRVGCTEGQARYWARERGAIGQRDVAALATQAAPPVVVQRHGRPVRAFTQDERTRLLATPRPPDVALARELGRNPSSIRAFFATEARREAIREELAL